MKLLLFALLVGSVAPCLAGSTLVRVRAARALVCGVNTEQGDFSRSDDHGRRDDFDRDLCRAVATAVLGRNAKIVLREFPDDTTAMAALRTGKVDLLPTLTLDFTHSTATGLAFSRPVLWDGVAFMVPVGSGVHHPEQLAGKEVCLLEGTEAAASVEAWFHHKNLPYDPFPYQEEGEMEAAFLTGGCAAIAGDQTRLASTRAAFGALADRFQVLPDIVATDPLAAAFAAKDDDGRFGEIVTWVLEILVIAEERGVTAASAHSPEPIPDWDATARRLAGKTHELGARLALADDWAAQVVAATGNYGEIFARDLGPRSAMSMPRGRNCLRLNGGLMEPLPLK